MKKNRVIFAQNDYQSIIDELELTSSTSNYYASIIDELEVHSQAVTLSMSDDVFNCDVLIIEDDISVILQYFKILEDATEVKQIYVCTRKRLATYVFNKIKNNGNVTNLKMILLDFDLYQTTDQSQKHIDALELYITLTTPGDTLYDSYRVIAISGYENIPERFSELQHRIRSTSQYFDLVLSKDFLDHENLLKNIFRNIRGVYEPLEPITQQQSKINKVGLTKSPQLDKVTNIGPNINNKRLAIASGWLNCLEKGLPEVNTGKFKISTMYSDIKRKNGKPFKHQSELSSTISNYKNEINFLLDTPSFKDKWTRVRYQINQYSVFTTLLQRFK